MKTIASRLAAAIVSAVAVTFCATSALAANYEMTFAGTVGQCCTLDAGGYFGQAGANVAGDSYVATYVYDPSALSTVHNANQNEGGLVFGPATQPILSASITINSHTYNVDFSGTVWDGDVEADTSHASALLCTNFDGVNCGVYLYNQISLTSGPANLTTTGTWSGTAVVGDFQTADDTLFLNPTSVTITQLTAATPLPAAMPLFAGGLAVVGWLARNRKRKATPVAA